MEKIPQEKELLNSIQRSRYSPMFKNEARVLLVDNLTTIQRVFRDSVNANDVIVNMLSMPRLARQEIERICLNHGNMRGTIKLLDEIFKYEIGTFYQFLYNLIINKQGDLVVKLAEEIKSRHPIALSFIKLPNNRFDSSLPPSSLQTTSLLSNGQHVDSMLRRNQSSRSNSHFSNFSMPNSADQLAHSTSIHNTNMNSGCSTQRDVDKNLQTSYPSSSNNNFSVANTADRELLRDFQELTRDVTEYFGSLQNFHRQLQQKRSGRTHQQREGFEPSEIVVESFDTDDFN